MIKLDFTKMFTPTSLDSSSAGGLVTAVAPVVIKYNGAWVGWTGLDDFDVEKDV